MTQLTKPSAGALRAADRIRDLLEKWNSLEITKIGATFYQEETARIIDRETGVAELLEAAKIALQYFRGKHENADASASRLKQAIAKCEDSR